jgi:predicted RNA-binding Zn ribbon-like protein
VARQVDGVWLPERVSGHAALELNNTVGGWGFAEPREYLVDYAAFVMLARDVDLLSAAESLALLATAHHQPGAARAALREVKRLRFAIHGALVDSFEPSTRPKPEDELHRFVAAAVRASRYRPSEGAVFRLDGGSGLRTPIHRFALSLHGLLEQHARSAIRTCADARCGWLFLDPSGRRRWCEMAVCGNRAKARRYAQRHRIG